VKASTRKDVTIRVAWLLLEMENDNIPAMLRLVGGMKECLMQDKYPDGDDRV